MTDFETHPAGTADLVKHLRGGLVMVSVGLRAADRIEELETALAAVGNASAHRITDLETELTRASAATAAAYEVAARAINDRGAVEQENFGLDRATQNFFRARDMVRALATPDQTAALDKLIAESEARGMERAAIIADSYDMSDKEDASYTARMIAKDIIAASKKGGV